MNEFDVIVVGGGPAGAAAAAFCARRGLRVALFEHKRFPREKVCGDVLAPGCWPVLERLGVAENVRALPQQRLCGARFTTSRGDSVDVPATGLVAIRRSVLDACLLEHARGCGVRVLEGRAVHEIEPGWPVVVGADGRHSVVARKAGLWRRRCRDGWVALQGHFRAPATMDERVQLHLFAGGYCGVTRLGDGIVNLCIVVRGGLAQLRLRPEELFAQTVWRNPRFRALGVAPQPLGPVRSAHPVRAAMNEPARGRVFLVGDALRVMEPFTGQGIFFALRTAELAAEAICAGRDGSGYAAAVKALYRSRGRTNAWLRRWLYRPGAAEAVMGLLRRWPSAARWLAANVLGD